MSVSQKKRALKRSCGSEFDLGFFRIPMIEYENTDLFFFIHDGFYVGLYVFKLSESDRTAIVWVFLSFN